MAAGPAGGFFHVLNCRLISGFFQESGPVPHLDKPLKHKEFFMLEVKNLTFHVTDGGEATILDNLSFTVPSGQITVITGPNGGGKSTLAKLIMGIERPTSGQILLDGQDITGLSITERARLGIGYAFQQPPALKGSPSGGCWRWPTAALFRSPNAAAFSPGWGSVPRNI